MTAFDYTSPQATANRLIERYGQLGKLRRPGVATGPAHDPTPGTPTDYPARFAVTTFKAAEIDGSRILATDKKVIMAKGSLPIDPAAGDFVVEANGEVCRVIAVDTVKPASTVVIYKLQVRR